MAFVLSKILWCVLSPGSLIVLMLGLGLLLERASRPRLKKTGIVLAFFAFFCLASIAVFPVGEWALTPLENRFAFDPPAKVDGIIVIGGDEQSAISLFREQPIALDSVRRYVTLLTLAKRYPEAKLVFSGGAPEAFSSAGVAAADIAQKYMSDIGVPMDRLIVEDKSRNTHENAAYAADLVHPDASQNWLLVTSAWHMTRAMACFRKAGWNVAAAPTGYFTTGQYRRAFAFSFTEQMRLLTYAMHEYIGLVYYYLMGRTDALWPR
ncbi:MAG: YdcF family protein [Bdellovibrionales bacterium]